jgi:hypothetical protein
MSAEPADPTPPPAAAEQGRASRKRRAAVTALIVLGALLGVCSVVAVWIDRTVAERSNYVDVTGDVLADPEVSDAVAAALVNDLWVRVDVPATLAERLPREVQPLAGPASAALQELTVRTAQRILARPRAQQLWRTANAVAHSQLMALIRGDSPASGEDGSVVLDLEPLVLELAASVGVTDQAEAALEARPLGQFVVVPADKVSTARKLIDLLDRLALVLGPLALIVLGAAVWLSRDRRRTLWTIAFVFIVVGIAVGVARRVGGRYLVDTVAQTPTGKDVGADVWQVVSRQLGDAAWTLIFVGFVALAGFWFAGAGERARAARHRLGAYLSDRRYLYGALALAVLLLLWWSPVDATRRVQPMVLGIALAILGIEALRRQVMREEVAPATT